MNCFFCTRSNSFDAKEINEIWSLESWWGKLWNCYIARLNLLCKDGLKHRSRTRFKPPQHEKVQHDWERIVTEPMWFQWPILQTIYVINELIFLYKKQFSKQSKSSMNETWSHEVQDLMGSLEIGTLQGLTFCARMDWSTSQGLFKPLNIKINKSNMTRIVTQTNMISMTYSLDDLSHWWLISVTRRTWRFIKYWRQTSTTDHSFSSPVLTRKLLVSTFHIILVLIDDCKCQSRLAFIGIP